MIYLDLIFNLTLLVAISVVSGFIEKYLSSQKGSGKISQGALFGLAAVIGMMRPLEFQPGLIFDGRSMVISLCTLFFGPLAGLIAIIPAIIFRVFLGGSGTFTGILVILSSFIIGWLGFYRLNPGQRQTEAKVLYFFGFVVHLVMLAMMFTLPFEAATRVISRLGFPVLFLYPLATLLVGKILSDQIAALRSQAALIESESMFRGLFENHSAVKLIVEPLTGAIVDGNMAAANYYGWSREHLREMNIVDINTLTPEEIKQEMALALSNQKTLFDFQHRRADGSIRNVEVFSSKIEVKGQELLYSIIHDVTERKLIEEKLQQSQKLETVGRLAGGVAHDFNNILTVVTGYSELAIHKLEAKDPLRGFLEEILKAARRSADLIDQLLAFARKQEINPRQIDLNTHLANMLKMLRHLLGENIELDWQPSETRLQVKIDPVQLEQILINLCVNARDAIEDTGKITIETKLVKADGEILLKNGDVNSERFVLLAISDNGCGIEKEALKKIFEPFYTTKSLHKGTGLGLATVFGIVQQNAGSIQVESEVGAGTTFRVYLPEDSSQAEDRVENTEKIETPPGKSELILLVEDEVSILTLAKKMLETLGYEVLAADGPEAALALLEKNDKEIGLLLTDVIMPDMNGRELAEKVQEKFPQIRVLFMSGYTSDVIAHRGIIEAGVNFISKPFSLQTLAEKVKAVLEQN